jgi:hypothetical protein
MFRTIVRRGIIGGGILFLLLQAVPYGWSHSNPPIQTEPEWDSPHTRELAVRACYDCHSNETRWPWYSYLAPVSWMVRRDVDLGRKKLNFSELEPAEYTGALCAGLLQSGSMPMRAYTLTHPEARLSEEEQEQLVRGFRASLHAVTRVGDAD